MRVYFCLLQPRLSPYRQVATHHKIQSSRIIFLLVVHLQLLQGIVGILLGRCGCGGLLVGVGGGKHIPAERKKTKQTDNTAHNKAPLEEPANNTA